MGFDLVGKSAKTERGEYFRNNCWWWRPLWNYICDACPAILTADDKSSGAFNDGHLINKEQSKRIAIRLEHLIKQGAVLKYMKDRELALEKLPDIQCDICKGTGKRDDDVIKGKCNGCEGKGTKRPWDTNYPFSEENVKEFAQFCRESGGFEIW